MAYIPIAFPPGIYHNGTEYDAKGRWFDTNLVRFYEGAIKPVGGWRVKSTSTVTGKGRAIITWKAKSLARWCAVGTESHLYAMDQTGAVSDITPSGFTAGVADAVSGGGFGTATYGTGLYGVPGADSTSVQDCTVWSLDTFGEDLVGCTVDDGKLYEWTLNVASAATQITNSPTSCRALVVTNERFLTALGAGGDPRNVQWADQQSLTSWTPSTTNQAGSFPLQTAGKLMQGLRIQGSTLLTTDIDAWLMIFTPGNLVYRFDKVGDGCGACSQRCMANFDGNAAWMGRYNFWIYNGYVQPLPCEVQDYVFGNLNYQQISKVSAFVDTQHGEITWQYPSSSSLEIDSYVTWNYRAWERGQLVWTYGSLARLSGADWGTFQYPLRVGTDGNVYEHEVGFAYGSLSPYLESGPIELGNGDTVFYATQLIPDDLTQGDIKVTFKGKFYPNGTETTFGPYTVASPTDVRFGARQVKARFTGVNLDDWRVGRYRLNVVQGGRR